MNYKNDLNNLSDVQILHLCSLQLNNENFYTTKIDKQNSFIRIFLANGKNRYLVQLWNNLDTTITIHNNGTANFLPLIHILDWYKQIKLYFKLNRN